jgi:hypothetical protein
LNFDSITAPVIVGPLSHRLRRGQGGGNQLSYRTVVAQPTGAVGGFVAMDLETAMATKTEPSGPVSARGVWSVDRTRAAQ